MTKIPASLESELEKEFQFTKKFTNESALLHLWNDGRIFVAPLPPYRQNSVELYLNKAFRASADIIVLLLPCDVSTDWFNKVWDMMKDPTSKPIELRFFNGRLKYEGEGSSYRVSSVLIVINNLLHAGARSNQENARSQSA